MKIFVSHAIKDSTLINDLKSSLEPQGLKLLIAEHHSDIEHSTITQKIEKMILDSDVALFLLTSNGFNSNFVQQEIGYIKSQKIPYLQIVEEGIEKKITGFNFGKGYVEYSPKNPEKAINEIKTRLLEHWNKREFKKQQSQQLMIRKVAEKKKQESTLKVGLGILAGILVLGIIND